MGFSRTNTTMDGWKCDKCNRVFLNAEDAEDCCVELGEPDKIVLPKCYNCQLLESRVRELEAERDRLKEERDEARELVTMRLEDMNKDGKTILDFYAVWLRQARDSNIKLRASHAALVEIIETISKDKTGKVSPTIQEKLKAALAEVKG